MEKRFPAGNLIRQTLPSPKINDPKVQLRSQLADFTEAGGIIKPGQKVALAVGSRGIAALLPLLKELISWVKSQKGHPYISPAMGSHGGATDQGQAKVLEELGISSESLGVPIVSHMQVKEVGTTSFGRPVWVGEDFCKADHVILINRIKPHTSFRGSMESGLIKMSAIGLGKQKGAATCHQLFFRHGFEPVVTETSRIILKALPVLLGVALVENRFEELACLKVLKPKEFFAQEPGLLAQARSLMGRIPFSDVDLLIIDEIGKNISGSGMDSNVTGRIFHQATPEPAVRRFRRIYLRDLTPETAGNALGLGCADFISQRLLDKIDLEKTRINCLTASVPEKGRIPLAYENDARAVTDALLSVGVFEPENARMVWVKNTLELDFFWASSMLVKEAENMKGLETASQEMKMPFDLNGELPFGFFERPHV